MIVKNPLHSAFAPTRRTLAGWPSFERLASFWLLALCLWLPAGSTMAAETVVANYSGNSLTIVNLHTGDRTLLVSTNEAGVNLLAGPVGVAREANGNLIIGEDGGSRLIRINPVTGLQTVLSSSSVGTGPAMSYIYGLAVDAGGHIIVASYASQSVLRVDPVTGDRTVLASSSVGTGVAMSFLFAVMVDTDESILFPLMDAAAIIRLDPATGVRTHLSSSSVGGGPSLVSPAAVLRLPDGDYAALNNSDNNYVLRIDAVTGDRTLISGTTRGGGPAIGARYSMALADDGNLYVADFSNNSIVRVDVATGDRTTVSAVDVGAGPGFNSPLGMLGGSVSSIVPTSGKMDLAGNELAGAPYTSGETYFYDPNDTPTDVTLSNSSVNQSGGLNATVGTLSTTDADVADTHTYTLVAGTGDTDNASFNISESSLRANDASVLAAGDYSVRIRTADNDEATFEKAVVVSVIDDIAPVITSIATANGTYGSAFGYTITATGGATGFGATGLPTGLSVDAGTGEISGSPSQTGVFNVQLSATDAAANADTQTLEITIGKAAASIALTGLAPTYDGSAKAVTASTTPDGLSVSITYDGEVATPTVAGSYAVVATINNDNFAGTANGTLIIGKAALIATADDASRAYGALNPAFTGLLTGAVAGDNLSVAYDSSATATSAVGPYDIVPAINDPDTKLGNYAVTLNNGTLTVDKAVIVATANNQSRAYGVTNPELTISYTGFVNDETVVALGQPPVAATVATAASAVGDYAITLGGGLDGNYAFDLVAGTLTVTPATLIATADNASRAYGASNPVFTGLLTGAITGDNLTVAYDTSAIATSAVGTYDIVPAINDPGTKLGNYAVTLNNGTLTVTRDNPVLALGATNRVYTLGDAPVLLASVGTVSGGGGADFGGGQLSVTVIDPLEGTSGDRLVLAPDEDETTGINLNGGMVRLGSLHVGNASGGTKPGLPLTVGFNTSATPEIVQSVLRRLAFSTTNNLATRTLVFALTDGDGGTADPVQMAIEINRRPLVVRDTFVLATNTTLTLPLTRLSDSDSDPDGDTFSLVEIDSVSELGGTVTVEGGMFSYTPAIDYAGVDTLTYLVRDVRGGETTGTVQLKVLGEGKLALLPVMDEHGAPSDMVKLFMGSNQPGRLFDIEGSNDLETWTFVGQGVVNDDGLLEFLDDAPRVQKHRFYRLLTPRQTP